MNSGEESRWLDELHRGGRPVAGSVEHVFVANQKSPTQVQRTNILDFGWFYLRSIGK